MKGFNFRNPPEFDNLNCLILLNLEMNTFLEIIAMKFHEK